MHHLSEIGIKASLVKEDEEKDMVGVKRSFSRRSEGIIKIEGKNIDYINVSSVTSQYGVNYFLDFLVKRPNQLTRERRKKTRMVKRKSPPIWGQTVDIEWKGDIYLSQQLNLDYQLKDILLQTDFKQLKGNIEVFPEPKHEYDRIRINYLLLSVDLFKAMDIIARHIKSGW